MKSKNNVLVFLLIAYGFSWLFWIPEALIAQNIWSAPESVTNLLAAFRVFIVSILSNCIHNVLMLSES